MFGRFENAGAWYRKITYKWMDDSLEEQAKDVPQSWAYLNHLILNDWTCDATTKAFWSWIFKKCGQVETLVLSNIKGRPLGSHTSHVDFYASTQRDHGGICHPWAWLLA
jgi:hypothetical protein